MVDKECLDYLEGRICDALGLVADFGKSLSDFAEEGSGGCAEVCLRTELEAEYDINVQAGFEDDNEVQQELKRRIKELVKINKTVTSSKEEERTALVKEGIVKEKKVPKRLQKGFFHVWFRGSNRYNVFYDEPDYKEFLERCSASAHKHKTAITAFALMNNHVHLQVYTHTLNNFMNSLLIGFAQWYNARKDMDGQLFKSPFSSSPIYSRTSLERNLLYILTNPVRAGMCLTAEDYKWSSFHFAKKRYYNPLRNIINVEPAAMEYLYKSKNSLIKCAEGFVSLSSFDSASASGAAGAAAGKPYPKIKLCKPNDSEVAIYLKQLLDGKLLMELSPKELIQIISILRYNQNATYRQIASLTHESYHHICKLLNR